MKNTPTQKIYSAFLANCETSFILALRKFYTLNPNVSTWCALDEKDVQLMEMWGVTEGMMQALKNLGIAVDREYNRRIESGQLDAHLMAEREKKNATVEIEPIHYEHGNYVYIDKGGDFYSRGLLHSHLILDMFLRLNYSDLIFTSSREFGEKTLSYFKSIDCFYLVSGDVLYMSNKALSRLSEYRIHKFSSHNLETDINTYRSLSTTRIYFMNLYRPFNDLPNNAAAHFQRINGRMCIVENKYERLDLDLIRIQVSKGFNYLSLVSESVSVFRKNKQSAIEQAKATIEQLGLTGTVPPENIIIELTPDFVESQNGSKLFSPA